MQTRASFSIIASIATAGLLLAGNLAVADDGSQQTATKQQAATTTQNAPATPTDKDAKAVSDSAGKVNLSTPATGLQFHGSVMVGYETTIGSHCHQGGMFSEVDLGTDIKLSKDVTMSIFVGAGRYPNSLFFR